MFTSLPAFADTIVFSDDFDDGVLDLGKWSLDVIGQGNSISEAEGLACVITYGHQGLDMGHAFIYNKNPIYISGWDSITIDGEWEFVDPGTAEMWFDFRSWDDTKNITIHYVSWPSVKLSIKINENTVYNNPRNAPLELVPFKLIVYKDHIEFYESDQLVLNYTTNAMESESFFKIVLGGWDWTSTFSHMYFDNIIVSYSEETQSNKLSINIVSPEERVYDTTVIPLNVTSNKPVDTWLYSLNGGANVTFTPNTTINAINGQNSLWVYASSGEETAYARVNFFVNKTTDNTPPHAISGLTHESGTDYIHWSWQNPTDPDFDSAIIYINNTLMGETDEEEWTLDNLPFGVTYTISILTKDDSGNINTTWINDTATTLTPSNRVYVNETGWWFENDFYNPTNTPLGAALKNALNNSTIIIYEGDYNESIIVGKQITIITQGNATVNGDGVISSSGFHPVITINSSGVSIQKLNIQLGSSDTGIYIDGFNNTILQEISIYSSIGSDLAGIIATDANRLIINNSSITIKGDNSIGIQLTSSLDITIENSRIYTNGSASTGVLVKNTMATLNNNTIIYNTPTEETSTGVLLDHAFNTSLTNNKITPQATDNYWDIVFINSSNTTAHQNRLGNDYIDFICPGDCKLKSLTNITGTPPGYIGINHYASIDIDTWLQITFYYNDTELHNMNETSLKIYRKSEEWTRNGVFGETLDINSNKITSNITLSGTIGVFIKNETVQKTLKLEFTDPTPTNNSIISTNNITVKVIADKNLSSIILQLDGINHTMTKENSFWVFNTSLSDGQHNIIAYATSTEGARNNTGVNYFTIDTKSPSYSSTGEDKNSLIIGDTLLVYAHWSDPNLQGAYLISNATQSHNWTVISTHIFHASTEWSNYTIHTAGLSKGNYCWLIMANDTAGNLNQTQIICFTLQEPLAFTLYRPNITTLALWDNTSYIFNISLNKPASIEWILNGSVKKIINGTTSTYSLTYPTPGNYTLVVHASNNSEAINNTWILNVRRDVYPPKITFVSPTPANNSIVKTITLTVSSNETLYNPIFYIDGNQTHINKTGTNFTYTNNQLGEGEHIIWFTATDIKGNQGKTWKLRIILDKTSPHISKIELDNATLKGVLGGSLVFTGERKHDIKIKFKIDEKHPSIYTLCKAETFFPGHLPIWKMIEEKTIENNTIILNFNKSEIGTYSYRLSIYDKAGNRLNLFIILQVVDTTPPSPPKEITITTKPGIINISWINPSDDDYSKTRIYMDPPEGKEKDKKTLLLNESRIIDIQGNPGEKKTLQINATYGEHLLFFQNYDEYGNGGQLINKTVNVPYPPFNIKYMKPTPQNNSEIKDDYTVTIAVSSSTLLRKTVLVINGESHLMEVKNNTAVIKQRLAPGLEYEIYVIAEDEYGRINKTEKLHLSSVPGCFSDKDSLIIQLPIQEINSLKIPVNIIINSTTYPAIIEYEAVIDEYSLGGTIPLRSPNIQELHYGYEFTTNYTINLWPIQPQIEQQFKENNQIKISLTVKAFDTYMNVLEDSITTYICKNPQPPNIELVGLRDFYYQGENITFEAISMDNSVAKVEVRVNKGEWIELNDTIDITNMLIPGNNEIDIIAYSHCGLTEYIKKEVFLGPPIQGDWIINNTQYCSNHNFTVNGSMIITETGNLKLDHSKIDLNNHRLIINGKLRISSSTINNVLSIGGINGELDAIGSRIILIGETNQTLEQSVVRLVGSKITGSLSFMMGDISIQDTVIRGSIKASGNINVTNSRFESGEGLILVPSIEKAYINNTVFTNGNKGIELNNVFLTHVIINNTNITDNSGIGLDINNNMIGGASGCIHLEHIFLRGNDIGVRIIGGNAVIENSTITMNNDFDIWIDKGLYKTVELKDSVVGDSIAVHSKELSTLILNNTSLYGSVEGNIDFIEITVGNNRHVTMKNGRINNIDAQIYGELELQTFEVDGGDILIYPDGLLLVEDTDNISPLQPNDKDPSILKDVNIYTMSTQNSPARFKILYSKLDNSTLIIDTKSFLIKGSIINGGEISFSTSDSILLSNLVEDKVFTYSSTWHYTKSPPSSIWMSTSSLNGMYEVNTPFVADKRRAPMEWVEYMTEINPFTNIYLKKNFNISDMPLSAILELDYVGNIVVYVNGKKVIDEPNNRQLRTTYVFPYQHGVPNKKTIDIAPYLLPGNNTIAVHLSVPYPYKKLGAFKAMLTLTKGIAGITDSVINTDIGGYGTKAVFSRTRINGDLNFGYFSHVYIRDSTITGHINLLGNITIIDTVLKGDGSGYGINTLPQYGWVTIKNCSITGYGYGIRTNNYLNIIGSDISSNDIGIMMVIGNVSIQDTYITNNNIGIIIQNITGKIRNNVFYNNNIGLRNIAGSIYFITTKTDATIMQNTFIDNNVATEFIGEKDAYGSILFYKNILQGNNLALHLNSSLPPTISHNAIIDNNKGVLVDGGLVGSLQNIEWGHVPQRVGDYTGGVMYTKTGAYSENYDILDKTWHVLWTLGDMDDTWGSDLLSAHLIVTPYENNGHTRGLVTLHGKAYSRSGLSSVKYILEYMNNTIVLNQTNLNKQKYDSFIILDSVGMNLTGKGKLIFIAKDNDDRVLQSIKNVYFDNAHVEITNFTVSSPTSIYVYRRDPSAHNTTIPYDERYVNVTVHVNNTGAIDTLAKIELVLPSYIERHTGRINMLLPIPANTSGTFRVVFPLTVYNYLTLSWDPLPDELPVYGKIPMQIKLYDFQGTLLYENKTYIKFDFGPIFEITKYNAYSYSRQYCNAVPEFCHEKNLDTPYTYDGDGDSVLEAAESHHFDIAFKNVGDTPARIIGFVVKEHVPEPSQANHGKTLKSFSETIYVDDWPNYQSDVYEKNIPYYIYPDQKASIKGLYMRWWYLSSIDAYAPPVNFTGNYLTTLTVIYKLNDSNNEWYTTYSINYKKVPVEALNKSFVPFTEELGPLTINVVGVKNNKTYLLVTNNDDNVYYSYYFDGYYDTSPEGYRWYKVIPPGFQYKIIVDGSKNPELPIPTYRLQAGTQTSLLFNELQLFAIGAEGIVGVLTDIDVPVETIVMAIAKAALKITNLVENIDFPEDQSIEEYANSPEAEQVNTMLLSDESVLTPITLDSFARWEKDYGMDKNYYNKLINLESLTIDEQAEVLIKFAKAMAMDDDLRTLLIETILEVIDNDDLNELYKNIQLIRGERTLQDEFNDNLDSINEEIKDMIVKYVKEQVKKKKSFQSLDPAKQEKVMEETESSVGAALETFEKLGEWTFYNIYAMLTQPLPITIQVLDPPGNYTVEAEKLDKTLLLGVNEGEIDGWGNITYTTSGSLDVYRAYYILPTQATKTASLFQDIAKAMKISINATELDGVLQGEAALVIKLYPEKASLVHQMFNDMSFTKIFIRAFFQDLEEFNITKTPDTITIVGYGSFPSLPGDKSLYVSINSTKELTTAIIIREGNYTQSLELGASFGINPENVIINVSGVQQASTIKTDKGTVIVLSKPLIYPEKPLEAMVHPTKLIVGANINIDTTMPCIIKWSLDGLNGTGDTIPTEGLTPGKHILHLTLIAGNSTVDKDYEIILLKPVVKKKIMTYQLITGKKNEWTRISINTDLYRIYILPAKDFNATIMVKELDNGSKLFTSEKYVVYKVFNVTHSSDVSLKKAVLLIKISKEWVQENNVDLDNIVFLRMENDSWMEYKATLKASDLSYYYYNGSVPGLSLFAVGEKKTVTTNITTSTGTMTTSSIQESTEKKETKLNDRFLEASLGALLVIALILVIYRKKIG